MAELGEDRLRDLIGRMNAKLDALEEQLQQQADMLGALAEDVPETPQQGYGTYAPQYPQMPGAFPQAPMNPYGYGPQPQGYPPMPPVPPQFVPPMPQEQPSAAPTQDNEDWQFAMAKQEHTQALAMQLQGYNKDVPPAALYEKAAQMVEAAAKQANGDPQALAFALQGVVSDTAKDDPVVKAMVVGATEAQLREFKGEPAGNPTGGGEPAAGAQPANKPAENTTKPAEGGPEEGTVPEGQPTGEGGTGASTTKPTPPPPVDARKSAEEMSDALHEQWDKELFGG